MDNIKSTDHSLIEFSCPTEDKLTVMGEIAALGGLVRDIDIVPPSLDDIYTSLVGGEEP